MLIPLLLIPVIYVLIALTLSAIPPSVREARSLNFERLTGRETAQAPELQIFKARDGQAMSYAHYPADTRLKVILVHGSAYHGRYLAPLASHLSAAGIADVWVPNIRGHLGSGQRRGDIERIGQLEADMDDLIALIRQNDPEAQIVVGGHSSGGAFAMRYASGVGAGLVHGYFGLAPFLGPDAPTMPDTDSGWAHISLPRIIGLSMLNTVGIRVLNGLETIRFNLPERYRDGSETLGYSYRLMTNFALRPNFEADIAGLPERSIIMVGSKDEAVKAEAFPGLFKRLGKNAEVLDNLDHFAIVLDDSTMARLGAWLSAQSSHTN
ncbi:alpha/beta hydrolase [Hoeflea prorocentri]|uniref:Alpha/beta fold hydrolase n=1 Tax=Hoeflea prorocentri TaxID=1922333 RepID=A0A9X3UHH7_9HYPH|nr:alpha/beta hydrolase [Hoeflea prorocentri]MCY6380754.1 alpha/beta fold hydrolase [Hoeflea prorocentri]MDA5398554.1 alpha/beta fold hydrolase [Hoeflea prorocentri]